MIPLSGTSTGSAGKASPHLQAWYDEKKAAEEKRKALEGDDSEDKKASFKQKLKSVFRPISYPKEQWMEEKRKEKPSQ
ncbi:hypothetical protein G7Y79_00008g024930 [Physcia stellaris]|nr:hypothetical protein G7Y79_00008g024930 [Physcia stellaris]